MTTTTTTATEDKVARVEELTLRFLDGEAAAAERDELAALVEADAGARRIHLGLIQVEVALRGGRPAEVAPAVMEQIARERAERAVRGVMSQVSTMTPIRRGPRPSARGRWPVAAAALAAAALAGVWWWRAPDTRTATPARRPPAMGRPAVAPPVRSVPRTVPPGAINVMALDFEDGELPEGLVDGDRAEGVCAPGGQGCLVGTPGQYDRDRNTITLERFKPPLFSYAPNQVLSFDYQVGADTSTLRVQIWSRDRRTNFRIELEELVRERWVHAEIRLSDLRGYGDKGPLEAGDAATNIMFVDGRRDSAPFYLDNLRVTAYPEDASLPATSAAIPIEP